VLRHVVLLRWVVLLGHVVLLLLRGRRRLLLLLGLLLLLVMVRCLLLLLRLLLLALLLAGAHRRLGRRGLRFALLSPHRGRALLALHLVAGPLQRGEHHTTWLAERRGAERAQRQQVALQQAGRRHQATLPHLFWPQRQ
jgi:hypothetical protein